MESLEAVLKHVHDHAARPFLIEASTGRTITYGEAHRLASNLARWLRLQGLRRGDRVVLLLPNSMEFALLYLACLYLGAVAVPIYLSLHRREVEFTLRHSGARLLIVGAETPSLVDGEAIVPRQMEVWRLPAVGRGPAAGERDFWSVAQASAAGPDSWQPFDEVTPDDIGCIVFTSGTTSMPKGVAHRIGALLGNAIAFNDELGVRPDDRFLHIFPMAYMAGYLNTLLCPFVAGAGVVLTGAFDARTMLQFWKPAIRHGVNTLWLAPTMLAALLRVDRDEAGAAYARTHIRTTCVGTASLSLIAKREFEHRYGVEVFESYGLSELLLVSGNSRRYPRVDGSVGRVLPGIELRVTDDRGETVRPGVDGEIWIKTPYAMVGYLDHETLQPIPRGPSLWFSTGDIGHISAIGDIFITGRKKDLIIRGGINISPRVVEEVLLEYPAVADVAVVGVPHEFYGEEVVAVVKLKPGQRLPSVASALRAWCQERLSAPAVPTQFVEVEEFPRSVTGKVQKAKLKEQLFQHEPRRQ